MLRSSLAVALLAFVAGPALAQNAPPPAGDVSGKQPVSNAASNIDAADTHTLWAPQLPAPPVNDNAPPAAFINAALQALAAGRTGEAQEAMERAESRSLTRAVAISKGGEPSQQPLVTQIGRARQALAAGDRQGAVQLLQAAAKNPDAARAE